MMRYVIFGCLISLCGALDCQICSNTILPPAACNDTHCAIDCEVKSCPKSGLCITEVALNHETGHEIQTFPLCQVIYFVLGFCLVFSYYFFGDESTKLCVFVYNCCRTY